MGDTRDGNGTRGGSDVGSTVELDVTGIAHGGISVARLDGRVVFVTDAIPGERVRARISDDRKKSFWRADTVEVLAPSPHRVPHLWPEASLDRDPSRRPGGAEFGHIALAHQRVLKAEVLRDALQRFAGIARDTVVEALPGDADGGGWRTRVRLHVAPDGTVGPYAARSHTVIPTATLPLGVPELAGIRPTTDMDPSFGTVDLIAPSIGDPRLILGQQKPSVIRERVGEREFRVDDGGFWQVHRAAATTLSTAVADVIDPARFDQKAANLDLYGGVGLLAAAIGDRVGPGLRITSVESDERATEHAAENLADWIGASTVTARVERWVRGLADASATEKARLAAATVVLDPPRAGAGREVLEALAAVRPAQLIYVACDPVAFARDAGILAGHGYEIESLRAFDLFPATHHVEAVASLRFGGTPRDTMTRSAGHRATSWGANEMSVGTMERPPAGATDTSSIRVAVVDDHESVRLGLKAAFEDRGYQFILAAPSVQALIDGLNGREVDVTVLDLSLGDGSSVTDNVKNVQAVGSAVLVHSIADRVNLVREALAAGAAGVIPKSSATSTVIAAAQTVARGEVLNNLEWATAIDADREFAKAELGRREREILHLYASGLPLKAAAEQLGIGYSTAREYLDRIRVKYVEVGRPAPTKVDLLRRAVEDGILPGLDADSADDAG